MKKIILALGLAITIQANAQESKTSIGVLPVQSSDGKVYTETVEITEAVTNGFIKTQRFILVERSGLVLRNKNGCVEKMDGQCCN